MLRLAAVALGGAVGALARYLLSGWVQNRADTAFPAGTLVVNVLGCLALGALLALAETRGALGAETRAFLAIGILGSFTTFSTFGWETVELARTGRADLALANIAASLAVGLLAVWLGRAAVKVFAG
jgi:CrcB protein